MARGLQSTPPEVKSMFGSKSAFTLVQTVPLRVQVGPFASFEELQSAVARTIPGAVAIPASPATAKSGAIKDSAGNVTGEWSMPYQFMHPLTLNAQLGPFETFEELQAAAAKQIPGTKLIPAALHAKDAHVGDVQDYRGQVTGQWTETR